MPLHLLPKKSYHVYNESNVARVRADEAAAVALEQAQEQRTQAVDAARRLAILRGETPPPLPEPEPEVDPAHTKFTKRDDASSTAFGVKKRKRKGEDDTDFEVRMARERAELGGRVAGELANAGEAKWKRTDFDIFGKDGHIDLIGAPHKSVKAEKSAEYENEAARKKRELEDQHAMRFSNAAGRDGFTTGDPWYASSSTRKRAPLPATAPKEDDVGIEATTKNAWGRDDPKRQEREVKRIISNDPLAIMRTGAKKVRELEKERKRENEERASELKELKELERADRRRQKRRRTERYDGDKATHRDRSGDSGLSRRRRHDHGRQDHRHRHGHRDDRSGSHERGSKKERPRVHDRHKERTQDFSRLSPSHGDDETQRGHTKSES